MINFSEREAILYGSVIDVTKLAQFLEAKKDSVRSDIAELIDVIGDALADNMDAYVDVARRVIGLNRYASVFGFSFLKKEFQSTISSAIAITESIHYALVYIAYQQTGKQIQLVAA